jgi:hypothetical protein
MPADRMGCPESRHNETKGTTLVLLFLQPDIGSKRGERRRIILENRERGQAVPQIRTPFELMASTDYTPEGVRGRKQDLKSSPRERREERAYD